MVTAISRRLAAGVAVGLICAGCGSSAPAGAPQQTATTGAVSGARGAGSSSAAAGFGWFAAQAPPQGWHLAHTPSGAVLPYPAAWRLLAGDPGTATAALRTSGGTYLGYLNITPRQGAETRSDWRSFRPQHNREEGDKQVRLLAFAGSLRFRTGHGTCVKDAYVGRTGIRYVEVACLISGPSGSIVAVGAAPPSAWPHEGAVIERAIEGVET